MSQTIKDWQIFKCPYCSEEYYDPDARKGKKVGDPCVACPACGRKSYRESILEAALIGAGRYFDIRFSSSYGNLRIAIIILYAAFLFVILLKRDFLVSGVLLAAAFGVFCLYGVIRVIHKRIFVKSDEYNGEIARSLQRLEDLDYARFVIASQGIDKDSVYYYEIKNS